MESQIIFDNNLIDTSSLKFSFCHSSSLFVPNDARLIGPHIHSCYEVYVNISGDMSFLVNNNIYKTGFCDIILSKPGEVHHGICNTEGMHNHFCLWINETENSPFTEFLRDSDSPFLCFETENQKENFAKLLSELENAEKSRNELKKTSFFIQIIDFLASKSQKAQNKTERIPSQLQQILDYINENFSSVNINDVLEEFYISPATLNRRFKKYLNLTPHEFLEAKRLSLAEQLLQKGYSVSEAAEESGFSDCSHFICVFKRRFGKTPNRYKKTLMNIKGME